VALERCPEDSGIVEALLAGTGSELGMNPACCHRKAVARARAAFLWVSG